MLTQPELNVASSGTFLNLVATPPSFVWGTLGSPLTSRTAGVLETT